MILQKELGHLKEEESLKSGGELRLNGSYHCDVEDVEKVKGQSRDQIHKEPGRAVMETDGACVVHHLTRPTHVGGAEIQDNV